MCLIHIKFVIGHNKMGITLVIGNYRILVYVKNILGILNDRFISMLGRFLYYRTQLQIAVQKSFFLQWRRMVYPTSLEH